MIKPLAVCIAFVFTLTACTVGPKYTQPKIDVPAQFDQAFEASSNLVSTRTFQAFASPSLDALIAAALENNTNLKQALARLDEARAYRGLTKYSLFPTVTANAAQTRSRVSEQDAQAPPGLGLTESVDVGADLIWEIDLFGSLRNQSAAIQLRAKAAQALFNDVKRVLVAEVAQAFFSALGARERLAITERNLTNLQENERIANVLVEAGRGTDLDLARAKSLRLSVAAQVPQLRSELVRQELRLATLTAQPVLSVRAQLIKQAGFPVFPKLVGTGTPEAWLKRRPDIQAAELNLRAALRDVGAQKAEYFPKLTLLGGFGSVAQGTGDLFGSGTQRWRFGPSISWEFLNFGRVGQFLQAEQAQARGFKAAYQESVLRALEEVEGALASFRADQESTVALAEAADEADKARSLAQLRFDAGASDFLVVLDAQRQKLSLDDQLIQAQTKRANAMAVLYKALAGDYVQAAQ